ncbi:tetratricopeptide repeat protein [Nonomuraea sp. NPDC003707]
MTIRAEGFRSIAAQTIGAATSGDHSPIIRLEPGTLKAPEEVPLPTMLTNLPRARSAVFVGRDDALTAMEQTLSGNSSKVTIGQVIHGMGGVGKSELARQYAEYHMQRYRLVWWITATSEEKISNELAALAASLHPPLPQPIALSTLLGIEQAAQWALNWLQTHDDWLLVLDNVEEPKHTRSLLAQLRRGHIVITTRRQVAWPTGAIELPLGLLTKQAATELIALTSERDADPDELPVFEAIAVELGFLPLALEQAGAYIRECRISPNAYQRLLADHPLDMYDRPRDQDEAEQTIARLWNAHLDVIRSRNPYAEHLLRVLACYAPEDVPRDILGERAAAGSLQVMDALRLLASYHLIKLEESAVRIHRLLQKVIAAADDTRAYSTERRSSPQVALAWLGEAWLAASELTQPEQASRFKVLSPHVESLTDHHHVTTVIGEYDGIFSVASAFEHKQGNYHRAESLARHHLSIAMASLGDEHPDTLTSRSDLGAVLWSLGRLDDLDAELRMLLETRRRVLGEEHPDTLSSRGNLGGLLQRLGRLKDAEAELRAVLELSRRVLGEEHPDTLSCRRNVAIVLDSSGRLIEAEAEHRAVLEARRRVLGEEHPDTLICRNDLALLLGEMGRLAEAEAEHRAVLQIWRRLLGEEHPYTLAGRSNLALVLDRWGRLAEAEEEQRAVLEVRRRVLGEEHPDTLSSRNHLAGLLWHTGRFAEARAELLMLLEVRRRVLGEEHPDTLMGRGTLAIVLQRLGQLEEAEAELLAVLDAHRRVLGNGHPQTLTSWNNLATMLDGSGRLMEARAIHQAVLEIRRRVLGEEHPDTLSSRNNLATVLQRLGMLEDAEAEYRAVLEPWQRVLGEEHPETLTGRNNLALLLGDLGRTEEAVAELRAVLQISRRVLGEEHPITLTVQRNLRSVPHGEVRGPG